MEIREKGQRERSSTRYFFFRIPRCILHELSRFCALRRRIQQSLSIHFDFKTTIVLLVLSNI